jgi:hypothetical protein
VGAFVAELGGGVEFVRLIVTPEHIEQYDLPTAPPKATDRRNFEGETVQAEALPPDTLAAILDDAIVETWKTWRFTALPLSGRHASEWSCLVGRKMSLFVWATGALIADLQRRTSQSGKEFVTAALRTPTDEEAVLLSVIGFDPDACAALLNLRKGDACAGERQGEAHHLDRQGR